MGRFPDIKGCVTSGKNIEEALAMAKDALCSVLCVKEDSDDAIPLPSFPNNIKVNGNSFVSLIDADTNLYRAEMSNRAVRKNISIPEWMSIKAERAGINLSQTLQEALRSKFN